MTGRSTALPATISWTKSIVCSMTRAASKRWALSGSGQAAAPMILLRGGIGAPANPPTHLFRAARGRRGRSLRDRPKRSEHTRLLAISHPPLPDRNPRALSSLPDLCGGGSRVGERPQISFPRDDGRQINLPPERPLARRRARPLAVGRTYPRRPQRAAEESRSSVFSN